MSEAKVHHVKGKVIVEHKGVTVSFDSNGMTASELEDQVAVVVERIERGEYMEGAQ